MGSITVRFVWLGMVAVLLLLSGCGDKNDPVSSDGGGNGNAPDTVTYTGDLKAVLDAQCISCHASNKQGAARNGAPVGVNWDTYDAAVASAARGNIRVQAGTMPPTGGIPQDQRDLFQKWLDQGLLE